MAKTPDAVSAGIINQLKTTIPGLSLELGTIERKIVDACAEAISESYIDQYLVGSLLDITGKSGLELEQFVGIFGFGRLQGRQATGVVRVELTTPATQDVTIQQGTQFYTASSMPGSGNPLFFASTQTVILVKGNISADVPVQCTVPGTAGNLPPDSVQGLGTILGASSASNLTAFTGGVDVESDDELRRRFSDTLLRNVAGTEDWYKGLAFQNKFISKVTVFGPYERYETEIVVPSDTLTLPVTADVKYAWPKTASVFKNLAQTDEVFYMPNDDFIFMPGSSPTIQRVSTGAMVTGEVVSVEFDYTTRASRNDPQNQITEKVDLFVNGVDPFTVNERTVITAQTLSTNPADEFYTGNFQRSGSSGTPSSTNRFMRLGSVPVVSFPASIAIGATVYQLGVHYHLLKSTTLERGSNRETSGIEWTAAGPATGSQITLNYVYNRIPEVLNAVMRKSKQITTDVLVHEANYKYLRLHLSVEYDRGVVPTQVNNSIQEKLRLWFSGFQYGDWFEFSDLMTVVHQVYGVDNIQVTNSTEHGTNYGIKVYDGASDPLPSVIQTGDFKLNDNTLPIFLEAVILRKPNK